MDNKGILIKEKDRAIIDEMISKVNVELMETMFKVASGKEKTFTIGEGVTKKYLEKWAESKYEFYLMFGRNFRVVETVDMAVSENEIRKSIDELCKKYPIYAPVIRKFTISNIISNKTPKSDVFEKYCSDLYIPGMKISKFLSKLFLDNKFDIDYSKVLQNKKTKGNIAVSIDPLDFLTLSTNKNGWGSCYSLESWYYSCAPFSCMLDETSLVAYMDNGKVFDYDLKGYTFSFFSKRARSVVQFSKENCQICFFRAQGNPGEDIISTWKEILLSSCNKYLGEDLKFKYLYDGRTPTYLDGYNGRYKDYYKDANDHHHLDDDATSFAFIPSGNKPVFPVMVGTSIFSLRDGSTLDKDTHRNPV